MGNILYHGAPWIDLVIEQLLPALLCHEACGPVAAAFQLHQVALLVQPCADAARQKLILREQLAQATDERIWDIGVDWEHIGVGGGGVF